MKIGLGVKFVVLVMVILSITMGVTTLYVSQSQKRNDYDQLNEKLNLLGSFISLISVDAMLSFDYTTLEDYMEEGISRPDMVYGVIIDNVGNTLTSHLNKEKYEITEAIKRTGSEEMEIILSELRKNKRIIFRRFEIRQESDLLGNVTLGISLERLEKMAEKSLVKLALMNGIIIFFLSLTIYLVFRISALKPIASLIEGSNRISAGNFDTPVDLHAQDELGDLSCSFNQMMQQLKLNILEKDEFLDQLSSLNSTLEERVISRTRALEESETQIRTIYDNIGEGIVVINDNGLIETVNKSAVLMFEGDNRSLIDVDIIRLFSSNTHKNAIALDQTKQMKDMIAHPEETRHLFEAEGVSLKGKNFPMEVVITVMKIGKKSLRVCIIRDISRRKKVESRLAESQQRVVEAAHQAGMAEIATGVLHNIGNVLNSVSISVEVISRITKASNIAGLMKANSMLSSNLDNIGDFLQNDKKGKKLPEYYVKLGNLLQKDVEDVSDEIDALLNKVTMIKGVISAQQNYAKGGHFEETFELVTIIEDALKVQEPSLYANGVLVTKEFNRSPTVVAQKSKLLQVITNLIKNAQEATDKNELHNKTREIYILIDLDENNLAYVSIRDNGSGIEKNILSEIFSHGFTTKESGHGFGLHASANAMTEMNGSLSVKSEGHGHGANFIVTLPVVIEDKASDRVNIKKIA